VVAQYTDSSPRGQIVQRIGEICAFVTTVVAEGIASRPDVGWPV
jgi:hypothetical protein